MHWTICEKALTWDLDGRKGFTDPRGYHLQVNEFDYMGMNEIVYQENGVAIRSWPAIHSLDGHVSFSVEWNGAIRAYIVGVTSVIRSAVWRKKVLTVFI